MNRKLPPRRTRLAVVGALLAILAAGCAPGGSKGGDSESGGVLRIGTSSGMDSMNPFVGINQDDFSVWMQIYPTLLQYDTTDESLPYIGSFAEEWEVSDDGLTITFHTVEGASWSDGEPLTAEDAAWTFQMMQEFSEGPTAGWSIGDNVISVEATDETTLVFKYKEPLATALYDVGTTPILPPQVWEQYAEGDGKGLKTFKNVPEGDEPLVSGGPFMLTKYRQGDIALFQRNPEWYGETPHIDGFGLQMYKNEDAMMTALASGELDAVQEIPPTAVDGLGSDLEVYRGESLALRDLIINSNPDKPKNRELLDPDVRMAIEYAIDREEIVDTAWLGHASIGSTLISPATASNGQQWHNSAIEPLPFDAAEANRILDEAGYERGPDGIRIADGHPMSYEVVFPDDEAGAGDRAYQIIQGNLADIGIEVTQKKLDTNATWEAIWCGDDCPYRDFDLAMWDWHPSQDPDFMLAAMTCDQWGNWNDVGYCNKEYDALHEEQKRALDPADRKKIIDEMQQIIFDDRPYIILTYDELIDAWSKDWEGLVESPAGFFNNYSTQSLVSVRRVG